MFPSAWADTELLDFLKLLRDDDWTQIDWNSAWIVISILPLAALAYCLPGILYWILMDPNADAVATEALIDYNLPRLLSEQGTNGSWSHLFNAEQKHLIAETVRLVRDLTFAEDPPMQKAANDILLQWSVPEHLGRTIHNDRRPPFVPNPKREDVYFSNSDRGSCDWRMMERSVPIRNSA